MGVIESAGPVGRMYVLDVLIRHHACNYADRPAFQVTVEDVVKGDRKALSTLRIVSAVDYNDRFQRQ